MHLFQDIRYSFRLLRKSPGFTLTAALTLGLGLGLNTAVFTVYNSIALRLLPVRDPGSLTRFARWYDRGTRSSEFSKEEFDWVRGHAVSFSDAAAATPPVRVPGQEHAGDQTELLQVQFVSNNYFTMLGVSPPLGRAVQPGEDKAGAAPVAVMSRRFWQRRFAGDPAVLGRTFLLNGAAVAFVGVAPEKFAGTGAPPSVPDLWIPMGAYAQIAPNQQLQVQILARRKPGISSAQIDDELKRMEAAFESIAPQHDAKVTGLTAKQATFFDTDSGGYSTFTDVVQVLMFAVGFVLLIGCVNLVNLMLARAAARQRDVAIRCGLGASRWRILRQLCTESALTGLLGGVVGFVFSTAICRFLSATLETRLASFGVGAEYLFIDLQPDSTVLLYAAALSVLTGILVGLGPARHALRADLGSIMKQETAAGLGGRGRLRNLMIGAQVAACLTLLMGAGLLWRGVRAAARVDPGFETRKVYVVAIPPDAMGRTATEQALSRDRVQRALRSAPQFQSVAMTMNPPLLGHMTMRVRTSDSRDAPSLWNEVSPEFFETLGIPVMRGRTFTRQEAESHAQVVMVSENGARMMWPGQDPIGQHISTPARMFASGLANKTFTVVGVAKNVRGTHLSKVDESYLYFPAGNDTGRLFLVRSNVSDRDTIPAIRAALMSVDRSLGLQAMSIQVENGPVLIQRMMTEAPATVAAALGGLGLLLAVVGIYGVVAFLVAQRTREIGLRVALGAGGADVARLILTQSLKPVLWGTVVGLGASSAVSVLLRRLVVAPDAPDLLFGVNAWDPATFAMVPVLLTSVVLMATVPALLRATKVDPAVALRWE